jgi:large subunit ribosomal protein L43
VQEDGLPLLRLGRKLEGHEVRALLYAWPQFACAHNCYSSFIKFVLPKFAASHPQIEFTVSPRPSRHPIIVGHYINGRQRTICVRNMEALEIVKKAEILRDASGEKLKKYNKPVQSINPSVRGVWSPYHGNGMVV